jgi:hypothetical protein
VVPVSSSGMPWVEVQEQCRTSPVVPASKAPRWESLGADTPRPASRVGRFRETSGSSTPPGSIGANQGALVRRCQGILFRVTSEKIGVAIAPERRFSR